MLEDFTVVKVMLTAIIVGCVGVFSLHALGLVKLHVKPTRYAANILGGLIFGVGFGLIGYGMIYFTNPRRTAKIRASQGKSHARKETTDRNRC